MFLKPSHPWNPGYALPPHVKAEPAGRGVYTTRQAPRGTISSFVPEQFYSGMGSLGADDMSGSLSGHSLSGHTLDHASLGDGDFKLGGATDPIAKFGKDAAGVVLEQVMSVPPMFRKETLKAILMSISPNLWEDVSKKVETFISKNVPIRAALKKALAAAFANHYLKQAREMATSGRVPQSGLMGLGCAEGCDKACRALGDFWDGVYKYTGAKAVVKGTKWVGGKAKAGAEAAYNAGKKAVRGLGKLACAASRSGLLDEAISMGSKAAGKPVSGEQAGKVSGTINQLCPGGEPYAGEGAYQEPSALGGLGLPLLIGGGVLAVVLLTRK